MASSLFLFAQMKKYIDTDSNFFLFSALQFIWCWFLEKCNPRFHCIFGNMETHLRFFRIPY